jgi:predicted dehydrogenase
MRRLRVAQYGFCHEHAAGKMHTLRHCLRDEIELVGVVDDRASLTPRFVNAQAAEAFADVSIMTEDELFVPGHVDVVLVETTNDDLVPTALRCAAHGLPMHLDKPGCPDTDAFRRLVEQCRGRRLPLQMGYMFRVNPAVQFAIRAVREGWLGSIFRLEADMDHNYGNAAYDAYIASFKGGIMYNLGCHLIDFIVAMLGKPERVLSVRKPLAGHRPDATLNALAILDYAHGFAEIRACSTRHIAASGRRLLICGSKGTIELCPIERFDKGLELSLALAEPAGGYDAGRHTVAFAPVRDRYENQFRQLFSIVRGETAPDASLYGHDLTVHEVVLAASGIDAGASP